jgi:serine/threonine-protein kinase
VSLGQFSSNFRRDQHLFDVKLIVCERKDFAMPFVAGQTINGYPLIHQPGAGGFSDVFETTAAGRRAAIKVLKDGADAFCRGLFVQEGDIIQEFKGHPRFPVLLDRGEVNGTPYLVFEWLDHPNSRGAVPVDQKIKLLAQICEALDAAHARKITHRDVHPSNFKLTAEGDWKLIDWGISYRPGSILETQPDRLTGTLTIMAPEAFRSVLGDPRSDLYSIGCCLFLYVAGAGRLPYGENGDAAAFRDMHTNRPITQFADLKVAATAEHQRLIDQLLAKEPDRRISSAAEVRERLLSLPPLSR